MANWQSLLGEDRVVLPWLGGNRVYYGQGSYRLDRAAPREHGWYETLLRGNRSAQLIEKAECPEDTLQQIETGYLVGDRFVADTANGTLPVVSYPRVHLLETQGLDRFMHVRVGRFGKNGPLLFAGFALPLDMEASVLGCYLDGVPITPIKGVSPGLEAAFRFECAIRTEIALHRERLELEERQRTLTAQRTTLITQAIEHRRSSETIHDRICQALHLGGAEFLEASAHLRNEYRVRFRFLGQRFECVCNQHTLQILDAGICLTGRDGVKGDRLLTLEALPSVIREAHISGLLVVTRHV